MWVNVPLFSKCCATAVKCCNFSPCDRCICHVLFCLLIIWQAVHKHANSDEAESDCSLYFMYLSKWFTPNCWYQSGMDRGFIVGVAEIGPCDPISPFPCPRLLHKLPKHGPKKWGLAPAQAGSSPANATSLFVTRTYSRFGFDVFCTYWSKFAKKV